MTTTYLCAISSSTRVFREELSFDSCIKKKNQRTFEDKPSLIYFFYNSVQHTALLGVRKFICNYSLLMLEAPYL